MADRNMRTVEQYVVVRENGDSGAFIVRRDGQATQEFYLGGSGDSNWHTISNTCQCESQAVTAGHFTSRRDANRAAFKANEELSHSESGGAASAKPLS